YLIRTGGATVLVDPVWSDQIPGRIRRRTPPGLRWEDVPRPDAVLITHNHYDHLDAPTIRRLPVSTPLLVPGGLGRWFRRRGCTDVTELDWWEHTTVAGLDIEFVPAHHWSRRGLLDGNRSLWGGWIVTAPDGAVIYHAGDSGYGGRFAEIGARHERIDIAVMPIGAYDPQWFMGSAHMHPEDAVRAAADVHAARMTWMHWGTFVLSREPMAEPARRATAAWAAAGRAAGDLWDLAIGETRIL
ncbi:MAG: MBL fold metallo-hydrolase, partial [Geodermatophilaceae bacterium]|nr:MBL fold metallo-hydrolase [Geodermatophilaceae bacterium]